MESDLTDILSHSYVVTSGGERMVRIRRLFSAAGLDGSLLKEWRWCRIPGDGMLGNAVSQYSLVRFALETKMPYLVVLEDDATPCDNAAEKIVEAFENRSQDTLCISLGWSYDSDPEAGDERGAKRRVYGSHAYALFGEAAYKAYLEAWEKNGISDIVLGMLPGSKMNKENLFVQSPRYEAMHLPNAWSADAVIERLVDGEMVDRYSKARAECERMRREREMHIVYTIDVQGAGAAQFMDQLLVSVYSLRQSMAVGDDICCHILYGNIPADLMRRLYRLNNERFRVEFTPIKAQDLEYMQSISNKKHDPRSPVRTWSGIVFARLWIPLALPNVDRCIYTDADTLIRKSVRPLWETDLEGNLLGCPTGSVPEYGFYSGLMLMDCKSIRNANASENLYAKLSEHLGKYAHMYFLPDQTTINRFFAGRIKEVDRTWCIPPRPGARDFSALKDASIWHFYEGGKPHRLDGDEFGAACLFWNTVLHNAEEASK